MLMVWDSVKRATNHGVHRMDFAEARDRFEWDTALVFPSHPGPDGQERFLAIGHIDDRLVFSRPGREAVSAISLRPASRKERILYADA